MRPFSRRGLDWPERPSGREGLLRQRLEPPDLRLAPFALRDIAVNEDEAAIGHRISRTSMTWPLAASVRGVIPGRSFRGNGGVLPRCRPCRIRPAPRDGG